MRALSIALLVSIAPGATGCARSHLDDASVARGDDCAPLFEDCDGSEADCAAAFMRGCRCGLPPHYVVDAETRPFPADRWPRMRWAGGRFVIPYDNDSAAEQFIEIRGATGGEVVERLPDAMLEAIDGTTLYVRYLDEPWTPASERDDPDTSMVFEVDASARDPSPEPHRPIRWRIAGVLGDGDFLTGRRLWTRGNGLGLLRAGEDERAWSTTEFPYSIDRYGQDWSSARDGARFAMLAFDYGADAELWIYEPYANELSGPLDYGQSSAPTIELGSNDTPTHATVVDTSDGWLVVWGEPVDGGEERKELVLQPLRPDGTPRGEPVRWRDEDARFDASSNGLGWWVAGHGDEVGVLYIRTPFSGEEELVLVRFGGDGSVLEAPRRVMDYPTFRHFHGHTISSFVWAGYSYAFAFRMSERPRLSLKPGLGLWRICN